MTAPLSYIDSRADNHPDYEIALDERRSGSLGIEFVHVRQEPHNAEEDDPSEDGFFALGVSTSPVTGQFQVDFGEGKNTFDLTKRTSGAYLNPPTGSLVQSLTHPLELVFIAMGMNDLSDLLGMETSTLDQAHSPLYEQIISDDPIVRPLALSMWQASLSDKNELYVDQAMQTLAHYLIGKAQGSDLGQHAFNDDLGLSLSERLATPMHAPADPRIARAIDYIEANLGEPLNITELAQVASMSNSQFSRTFKSTTGLAAWAFVRSRRLEVAKTLIATTRRPMADIAYSCGFSSQSHLATAFLDRFKATPMEYREQASQTKFYLLN